MPGTEKCAVIPTKVQNSILFVFVAKVVEGQLHISLKRYIHTHTSMKLHMYLLGLRKCSLALSLSLS